LFYHTSYHMIIITMANPHNQGRNIIRYINDGRLEKIRRCIQYGYNYNQQVELSHNYYDTHHTYPILVAIKRSKYQIVKLLLGLPGININVQTCDELNTVLHLAAKEDNTQIAKLLLDAGADINAQRLQYDMKTPLHLAIENCRYDMIMFLLANGANINIPDNLDHLPFSKENINQYGKFPLFIACSRGDLQMVQFLCQKGANIYQADDNGNMAIFHTCMCSHEYSTSVQRHNRFSVVNFLLDQGFDNNIDIPNGNGQTVLFYACRGGHLDIVKLLLIRGANINHLDSMGQTILFHLSFSFGYNIARYLLECGIDHTVRNMTGDTAIEHLTKMHNIAFAKRIAECINERETAPPTKGVL